MNIQRERNTPALAWTCGKIVLFQHLSIVMHFAIQFKKRENTHGGELILVKFSKG